MMKEKGMILGRVYLFFGLIFLLAFIVIGRITYLQYIEDDKGKEDRVVVRRVAVQADRGNILADDYTILVTSNTKYKIAWDATIPGEELFKNNKDTLAEALANLFQNKSKAQYLAELEEARKDKNQYHTIAKDVSYDNLIKIRNFPIFKEHRYVGGYIEEREPGGSRSRLFTDSPGRTLGWSYINNQKESKWLGLEETFDDYLKGVEGEQLQKMVGSNFHPIYDASEIKSKKGYDIVTSLNVKMQDIAESALRAGLTAHNAERGCVVVMDVETGFVKAIVNLQRTNNGEYREKVNDAVSMKFEPGSTFKLASMLVLMEDGKIKGEEGLEKMMKLPFDDNSSRAASKRYGTKMMRDSHAIGDGNVSVREVFEQSSNVGTSMLVCDAYQNQPENFIEGLHRMRLNKPLGLDIKGEANPNIKTPKSETWSKLSLPWMSIGYELEMTPFQILTLYNAVANNGKMVKPQFVKEIREDERTIKTFDPIVLNEAIASSNTIKYAQTLLKGVVQNGTAKRLKADGKYEVAGKTGTSRRAKERAKEGDKGYEAGKYNASFAGYFKTDDFAYSCIVVVVNPSEGSYYGGSVAAPIFKEIADKIYVAETKIIDKEKQIAQKKSFLLKGMVKSNDVSKLYQWLDIPFSNQFENETWTVTTQGTNNQLELTQANIEENKIPNVCGMGAKDAVFVLEDMGLKVSVKGKGCVKTQSVAPGSKIKKGQHIELQMIAMK